MKHAVQVLTFISRKPAAFIALPVLLLILAANCPLAAQQDSGSAKQSSASSSARADVQIVSANGYPELHVDGQPFFVHAAAFDYFSIPRDLWEHSLESYKNLGFNTIALRIPWNWHESVEGEFDFDGHSNPRRDLRALLGLISGMGFKLIAEPGPILGSANEQRWPNGGIPDWLLAGEKFKIDSAQSASGGDAAERRSTDSNTREPSAAWMTAEAQLQSSEQWLAAVAHELIPYSPARSQQLGASRSTLLFVILGAPIPPQAPSEENSWQYADLLKKSVLDAGLAAHCLVVAATPREASARPSRDDDLAVASRWLDPEISRADFSRPQDRTQTLSTPADDSIAFLIQSLKVGQVFPPIISDFGINSEPSNASADLPTANRFLDWSAFLAQGAAGVIHSSLQNTLPPAGFLMNDRGEDVHQFAALDFSGEPLPHSERVRRERALITRLGSFFASSHRRTVFGIIDWRSGAAFADEVTNELRYQVERDFDVTLRQIERVSTLANIPVELADPGRQSAATLARDPALLLLIPESLRGKQFLSADAQNALLEYVRAGGALICDPELPRGTQFAEALQNGDPRPAGDGITVTALREGRIIVWSKSFSDWVMPGESPAESRVHLESAWAVENLKKIVTQQSANLPVLRSDTPSDALSVSELVPNVAASGASAPPQSQCNPSQYCGAGVLSVANWGDSEIQETLKILPPAPAFQHASTENYVELPVTLRAHDALFLPLDVPLCGVEKKYVPCSDRIIAAGSEFVSAARDGKFLELTFYAPSNATVVLHLAAPPRHLELPERTLQGEYVVAAQTFTMSLPRGAAPDFLRTVKLDLSYTPFVSETVKPERTKSRAYRFSVTNSVRLPLGEGASLSAYPPLISLDPELNGRVVIHFQNLGDSALPLHVDISGVDAASRSVRLEAKERNDYVFEIHGTASSQPDAGGLLHGVIHVSGGDRDSDLPIDFISQDPKSISRYRKDFARDGSLNWVLENDRLRLITSPATDGSIVALVEKNSDTAVFSAGGGAHDLFGLADSPQLLDVMRNVAFTADWDSGSADGAIHFHGRFPENFQDQLEIDKIFRFVGSNSLQISYRVTPASQPAHSPPVVLVSEFSLPAFAGGPTGTQFCWQSSPPADAGNQMHCEAFTPDAPPLKIPESTGTIEIRAANRATVSLEWNAGGMAIDQRKSYVRLLWNLPSVSSGSDVSSPNLNISVIEPR